MLSDDDRHGSGFEASARMGGDRRGLRLGRLDAGTAGLALLCLAGLSIAGGAAGLLRQLARLTPG